MSERHKGISLPQLSKEHAVIGFPNEREILADIAGDFITFDLREARGETVTVIPGFEQIVVDRVSVGEWMTAQAAYGEGGNLIVGASFTNGRMSEKVWVYRNPEHKRRHEASLNTRRAGASRIADDPERRIENAIAGEMRARGHIVRQQVRVPAGIIDIVDDTARLIVECKASSKTTMVLQAIDQLDRYMPHFPDYSQALGLPDGRLNPATARSLASLGIAVFTPENCLTDNEAR